MRNLNNFTKGFKGRNRFRISRCPIMLTVLKLKCRVNMQFDFKRYLNFCLTSLRELWRITVLIDRVNIEYYLRKSLL